MEALPYAVVAFLDFLGFREMIEQDAGPDPPRHLPLILDALEEIEGKAEERDLAISQFSDSVILAASFSVDGFNALSGTVRDLQRVLIEREIAVRGGIAMGQHYAGKGRLFSHALVKAYLLEAQRAKVPRVLIDKNLLDWAFNHDECTGAKKEELKDRLLRDRDGEVFIHYLSDDLLPSHEKLVLNMLERGRQVDSSSIISKAYWIIDYHQFFSSLTGVDGIDEGISSRFSSFH